MTTVYVPWKVTSPDGEDVELELAADVSADREVIGLNQVRTRADKPTARMLVTVPVPEWALRQIDRGDLDEEVQRRLEARERGWP